ncbi:hypothetical protein ACFV1B_17465 [Streptomyces sp. NPDC059637]
MAVRTGTTTAGDEAEVPARAGLLHAVRAAADGPAGRGAAVRGPPSDGP